MLEAFGSEASPLERSRQTEAHEDPGATWRAEAEERNRARAARDRMSEAMALGLGGGGEASIDNGLGGEKRGGEEENGRPGEGVLSP